jgi:hypothetical protein
VLFKYTTIATARLIIESRTVRFRTPKDYNDPFDAQWNTLWQLSTPEFNMALAKRALDPALAPGRIDARIRDWIKEQRTRHRGLSPAQKKKHIREMVTMFDQGIVERLPDQLLSRLNRLRVFCLAERPDSVQMWGYYAQEHAGVVLAFDTLTLERHWEVPTERVTYAESLPEIVDPNLFLDYILCADPLPSVDHREAARAWTLTKAQGWSHEEEWRFVFMAAPTDDTLFTDQAFPEDALVGLVAGCKACPRDFAGVVELAEGQFPQLQVQNVARHATRFDLVAMPWRAK